MNLVGVLKKMTVKKGDVVQYYLDIDSQSVYLNDFIGKEVKLEFLNKIICQSCGKTTKKSYFQGFCYPCMVESPQASECILRPELCQAHNGISRDMKWSEDFCLKDHYVYLAVSSGLKVGVTRSTQIPIRWIDQGASQAIILAKTPNRHQAGLIEVELKKNFADKTSWQRMLKNQVDETVDLIAEKKRAKNLLPSELQTFVSNDEKIYHFEYPVIKYPQKIKSLSFDKQPEIEGKITGIKGQYLLLNNQFVFNVRKHTGYLTKIEF